MSIMLMTTNYKIVKTIIFIAFLTPFFGLATEDSQFTVKILLLDREKLCVSLFTRNNSKTGVYIPKPTPIGRGTASLPHFEISSSGKMKSPYKGAPDIRRWLKISDYVYIQSGQIHIDNFCLSELFDIDEGVDEIWFESFISSYKLEEGAMVYLDSEHYISNVLKIRNGQ